MTETLNQNSILQVLSSDSPDSLARLIRKIKVPIQIISFTADENRHHCYFRCRSVIKIVNNEPVKEPGLPVDAV